MALPDARQTRWLDVAAVVRTAVKVVLHPWLIHVQSVLPAAVTLRVVAILLRLLPLR
jgi:hypothetical protein